ncbi:glycosyltransferase [Microbacterium sp. zg-YB36]|uniref:glycosyltransferase n=1 Tax=Microbacterium sp. zg-YB36 TaxID=2969407 RepID=UPI00214BCEB0|nr:glycosyltransferase [Microbacterium sp. zg-YB36]MDL5352568.1 glycosyltransferase [Microbacterium sp. zg-YB36]
MTTTLRVVLDALVQPAGDLAEASRELTTALVRTAPSGCEVAALVPAAPDEAVAELRGQLPGIARIDTAPLGRRELAASWQLGIATGAGGGMIHSPSLMAPLVRHDRAYDHDQTVVTVWDLTPWEAPDELPRGSVMWHKAMLKRAAKHADAVVVPTHAHAERLAEFAKLGDRIRVIAGAAPAGFAVPTDEVGRRRALELPAQYVLIDGGRRDGLDAAFAAAARAGGDLAVVVTDVTEEGAAAVADIASAAGLPEAHLHVRGRLDAADRAAVLGGAATVLASSTLTVFPWLVVEALAVGAPVVAAACEVHREVIVDGGLLVDASGDALAAGLAQALGSDAARARLAVLAGDRGRAFSWLGAAERVWQLHAEL